MNAKKQLWLTHCIFMVFLAVAVSRSAEDGDRHPQINCVYPPEVYWHTGKGGRVIDVTKPPFDAKGDGQTDDTAALVKAYDFVLAEMNKCKWTPAGPESPLCEHIIYLPNGI